jgi:Predicted 3'-5' exonuclease related to the exonuclease domain of PolB
MAVVFDIETGGSREKGLLLMPPFDPDEVKVGNMVDPDKIKAKINGARLMHERNWLHDCALRPETGHVLAIGMRMTRTGEDLILHVNESGGESEVLRTWWDYLESTQKSAPQMFIGFACFHFDLPYLILRSRILNVPVPIKLRIGRFFNAERFVDLQDEWLLNRSRNDTKCSLDYVAKAMGIGEKSGSGTDFEKLYRSDQTSALDYLRNDLMITEGIARKLGFVRLKDAH